MRSPLAGKLIDETGDRLTPSHANKKGRRYRYYVSRSLIAKEGDRDASGWRLPAVALEAAVAEVVATTLEAPSLASRLLAGPSLDQIATVNEGALAIAPALRSAAGGDRPAAIIASGRIAPRILSIDLDRSALALALGVATDRIDPKALQIETPFELRRRGVEAKLMLGGEVAARDEALLRNAAKAMTWLGEIQAGASVGAIAEREGVSRQRINQILRLAFLAPDLTNAILAGRQSAGFTMDRLSRARRLDLWVDQRAWAAHLDA